MEQIKLNKDISVFGKQVETFPVGIGEKFNELANMIDDGFNRAYYGITFLNNEGDIEYYAAAETLEASEPKRYKCTEFTIPGGSYVAVGIRDWRKKTDSIKDIFHELMKHPSADKTKPCIEWYKDDDEMICMIAAKK